MSEQSSEINCILCISETVVNYILIGSGENLSLVLLEVFDGNEETEVVWKY